LICSSRARRNEEWRPTQLAGFHIGAQRAHFGSRAITHLKTTGDRMVWCRMDQRLRCPYRRDLNERRGLNLKERHIRCPDVGSARFSNRGSRKTWPSDRWPVRTSARCSPNCDLIPVNC
jgi:hypothetical protein